MAVQDAFIQDKRQLASHAPADSVPQILLHPIPTQFLLQPCIQFIVQPLSEQYVCNALAIPEQVPVQDVHRFTQYAVQPDWQPDPQDVEHVLMQLSKQEDWHPWKQEDIQFPTHVPLQIPIQFAVQPEEQPLPIPVLKSPLF